MYAVMRLFSLLLVVIALMLLGADAVTSLEHQGQITVRSFEMIWALFNPGALAAFKSWAAAALPGWAANATYSVIAIPAWSIGVIGVLLAFVFSRKEAGDD